MYGFREYHRMLDIVQKATVQYWSASMAIRNYEKNTAKKNQYEGFFKNIDSFIESKLFSALENFIKKDIAVGGEHKISYLTSNGNLLLRIDSLAFCGSKGVTPKMISNMKCNVPDSLQIDGKSAYEVLQTSFDIIKNFGEQPLSELVTNIYRIHPFIYKGIDELIEHFIKDYDNLKVKIVLADDYSAHFNIFGAEDEQLAASKLIAVNEKFNVEFKEGKIYIGEGNSSMTSLAFNFHSTKNPEDDTYHLNCMDIALYNSEETIFFTTGVPEKLGESLMKVFMEKSYSAYKKMVEKALAKQALAKKGKVKYEH